MGVSPGYPLASPAMQSNSGDIASGAKGIAGNAASGLKSKVAGAKGALGGAKDKIQDALPDSPGQAVSDAKDAAKEGASAVKVRCHVVVKGPGWLGVVEGNGTALSGTTA